MLASTGKRVRLLVRISLILSKTTRSSYLSQSSTSNSNSTVFLLVVSNAASESCATAAEIVRIKLYFFNLLLPLRIFLLVGKVLTLGRVW